MRPTTACKRIALQNCEEMTHKDGTFRLGSRGWPDMTRMSYLMKLPLKPKWMHVKARLVLFSGCENNHGNDLSGLQTPVNRSDGSKCSGVEEILERWRFRHSTIHLVLYVVSLMQPLQSS